MKKIKGEQKDHHDTEEYLQCAVGEEDLFHLFDFLQTQFQTDRKHQKYDPEFPDQFQRIISESVESEEVADDRPRRDIS